MYPTIVYNQCAPCIPSICFFFSIIAPEIKLHQQHWSQYFTLVGQVGCPAVKEHINRDSQFSGTRSSS